MATKQKKKRGSGDKPSLEMTPMIDCVFQLLIFFIVTMKQDDILSNLDALRPAPDSSASQQKVQVEPVTILVGQDGLSFNGKLRFESMLESDLRRIAKSNPDVSVIIKCTGNSRHGLLVRALDICNKVGLRNLSVFSM